MAMEDLAMAAREAVTRSAAAARPGGGGGDGVPRRGGLRGGDAREARRGREGIAKRWPRSPRRRRRAGAALRRGRPRPPPPWAWSPPPCARRPRTRPRISTRRGGDGARGHLALGARPDVAEVAAAAEAASSSAARAGGRGGAGPRRRGGAGPPPFRGPALLRGRDPAADRSGHRRGHHVPEPEVPAVPGRQAARMGREAGRGDPADGDVDRARRAAHPGRGGPRRSGGSAWWTTR
jgi:hypothetical protein